MRTIIVGIFLILFFIISIPLFLVEIIIGKFNKQLRAVNSYHIVRFAIKIVLLITGGKYTVLGRENIDKSGTYLYVSNHRSYFDIVLGLATVPTWAGFIAKKEMAKIPFLRIWMQFINCLFLDRDDMRAGLKTMLTGIDYIKGGYSMFICPEGTRNPTDEMFEFKEGSLKMAEKTGCPIIPVAFTNTESLFEKNGNWVKKAHVIIEYGKPIYVNDLTKEEKKFLGSYTQNIIKDMLIKNNDLI